MSFLQRFFYGRNGVDQLNMVLAIAALALTLLSQFIFQNLFVFFGYAALGLCVFRMVSRNVEKRRKENAQFLALVSRFRGKTPRNGNQGNFCYLKCPGCQQTVRVPRGKGKVKITCSRCGRVFYEDV